MSEPINILSVYASTFSITQRKSLLSAYREYVSLVRNYERIVRKHKVSNLALIQVNKIYESNSQNNPWQIEAITPEDAKAYQDFLSVQKLPSDKHYCFISLDLTDPNQSETTGIMFTPKNYKMVGQNSSLPARIERYVAAFPNNEKIANTKFIIGGRYVMTYENKNDKRTIEEVLQSSIDEKKLYCMLDIMTQCPQDIDDLDVSTLRTAQNETMASDLTSRFENMILAKLSTLAEETDKILANIPQKNKNNYLTYAESNNIIPSAARMQEFLNIRHLMHHQWETLDNIGRYTSFDNDKNFSIRRSLLEAYHNLCGKPLFERLNSYIEATADFSTLTVSLNPDLFVRGTNESNSKFITRIKNFSRQNPETPFFVDTNYQENSDKKSALIKNIQKLFPQCKVIDESNLDIEGFIHRVGMHIKCSTYLDYFQRTEYQIGQHYLLRGKSQPALSSWRDLVKDKIISPTEAKEWAEFKKLRNELSHHNMTEELEKKLDKLLPAFMNSSKILHDRLSALYPKVYLLEGNVFRAEHDDGKIVDINFLEKRVLNVMNQDGNSVYKEATKRKPSRQYTEEYHSGVSITTAGTEINKCRLPNGIDVNFSKASITYPDGAVLLTKKDKTNILICDDAKVVTDKQFKIVNFVNQGHSITINRNDILSLPNQRKIIIGADGKLKSESWITNKNKIQTANYRFNQDNAELNLGGGTIITFTKDGLKLSHNGVELSYETRKLFAEGYNCPPPNNKRKSKER